MNRADAGILAWALADAANGCMDSAHRAAVCAKIGAGEPDSAIRDLLVLYAKTDAKLPLRLAAPIRKWIEGYAGTDCEALLQFVYDRITLSVASMTGSGPPQPEPDRSPPPLVAKRSKDSVHRK